MRASFSPAFSSLVGVVFEFRRQFERTRAIRLRYRRIAGSLIILLALLSGCTINDLNRPKSPEAERTERLLREMEDARIAEIKKLTPEIVKNDCQKLVDGQLLFEPSRIMRQGSSYGLFARLTRNPGVDITSGLNGAQFVIVREMVSCKVSMSLDSEEPSAFLIEKMPSDRKDEQVLEPDKYSQWDWRVTPRKTGPLHLLLFVTPTLYVEGIGEELKQFKQPPRVITVTPDYWYETHTFLKDNWAIISGLLTAILIPLFLWFRKGIVEWSQKRFKKKVAFYTLPPPPDKSDSAKS